MESVTSGESYDSDSSHAIVSLECGQAGTGAWRWGWSPDTRGRLAVLILGWCSGVTDSRAPYREHDDRAVRHNSGGPVEAPRRMKQVL